MSERITDIVERVRRFMESDVYPLEEHTNGEPFYTILPLLEQKRVRVKELGLWTPQVPEEWGGLGLTLSEFGQISEVMGRSPYGLFIFNCNNIYTIRIFIKIKTYLFPTTKRGRYFRY